MARGVVLKAKAGLTSKYEDSHRDGLLRSHDLGESNLKIVQAHRGIPESIRHPARKLAYGGPFEYTPCSSSNIEGRSGDSATAIQDLTKTDLSRY